MSVSTPWRPYVLLNEILAHSAKMYLNKSHKTLLSCWEHQNTKTTPFVFHADFWWYCWFQSPDSTFFRVASGSPKWPNGQNGAVEHKTCLSCWEKATKHKSYALYLTFCLLLSLCASRQNRKFYTFQPFFGHSKKALGGQIHKEVVKNLLGVLAHF